MKLKNNRVVDDIYNSKNYPRLYRIWAGAKYRCNNPTANNYKYYGGKGITFCKEWERFAPFCKWALNNGYEEGLTLDRIDNKKGYSPENCTWITKEMQYKNKRQNLMITYNGRTLCAEDWSKETGIPATTIRWRFKHGWEVERIFQNALPAPYKKGE